MNLIIALIVGLMAGLHTSTWGMYKDAPHEGFTWSRYFRSTVVGGIVALGIVFVTTLDVTTAPNLVVLFGFTYVLERAIVEFYKTFLREQDQSKYFIPMQFSVKGEVVQSRAVRLTVGFSYMALVLFMIYGMSRLETTEWQASGVFVVLAIGSVGGWLSAFGGAWKDAPKEGFQIFKFFRSPVIALIYAFTLANLTTNIIFMSMGALGYTIATIETYKTFFFPNRPRGKFSGMPIKYPEMLKRRQYFVPLYAAIWVAIVVTVIMAFFQPHEGFI